MTPSSNKKKRVTRTTIVIFSILITYKCLVISGITITTTTGPTKPDTGGGSSDPTSSLSLRRKIQKSGYKSEIARDGGVDGDEGNFYSNASVTKYGGSSQRQTTSAIFDGSDDGSSITNLPTATMAPNPKSNPDPHLFKTETALTAAALSSMPTSKCVVDHFGGNASMKHQYGPQVSIQEWQRMHSKRMTSAEHDSTTATSTITTVVPVYRTRQEFLNPLLHHQVPSNDNNGNQKVHCYFPLVPYSGHFPHAMQYLYRCWSWFNAPQNRNKHRILWLHEKAFRKYSLCGRFFSSSSSSRSTSSLFNCSTLLFSKNQIRSMTNDLKHKGDFYQGFVSAMEGDLNVTVRPLMMESTFVAQFQEHRPRNSTANQGYGLLPQDARALAQAILLGAVAATATTLKPTTASESFSCCSLMPRIAILNRKQNRKLENALELAARIEMALDLPDHYSNAAVRHSVKVGYFEHATFMEQVLFLVQTDILITPHGAALAGLPFLGQQPQRCEGTYPQLHPQPAVLEIFPKGYCIPYFFGSLAVNSGIRHSYFSLGGKGQSSLSSSCHGVSKDPKKRLKAKQQNLCPPLEPIVQAVLTLVRQWRGEQCCPSVPAKTKENEQSKESMLVLEDSMRLSGTPEGARQAETGDGIRDHSAEGKLQIKVARK